MKLNLQKPLVIFDLETTGLDIVKERVIQLADPSRAGLVLPSEQPEGQDVLMLMMPMLIND